MGEMFVEEAARLLAEQGVVPEVIAEAAPTPAIAYAVRQRKTSGAINFTASHNPPEYNGIKFSTPDGAPALPEVTQQIEAEIAALGEVAPSTAARKEKFDTVDVKPDYLKRLAELVDIEGDRKSAAADRRRSVLGSRAGVRATILAREWRFRREHA